MSENKEFETIELKIPKTIIPMIESVGKLAGKDISTLLSDIVRCEFQDMYEEPHRIIDYLDRAKCTIFIEAEKGFEQWVIQTKAKKDHKQEEKTYAHT